MPQNRTVMEEYNGVMHPMENGMAAISATEREAIDADVVELLVSVIIPCYNHGGFLAEAIASVHRQTYPHIEIVVVDDGSTDNTKAVAAQHAGVHYVYQNNQGLSAARNKGISESKGAFLVFLDADDLLFSDAVAYNVEQLQAHPEVAFISGAYDVVSVDGALLSEGIHNIGSNHYLHLLRMGNYIGMHATVMFRRRVFDRFRYDTTLRACEDYDLYLQVARHHPVLHHTKKMAAYRMHGTNMSGNVPMMLETTLAVLRRHQPQLRNSAEQQAFKEGIRLFKDYYGMQLYGALRDSPAPPPAHAVKTLIKHRPDLYFKLKLMRLFASNTQLKEKIPEAMLRLAHRVGVYKNYHPAVGRVAWGDLGRTTPISTNFGYERGGPIDRYYIENFLAEQSTNIRGRVLEIGDNEYTLRYGAERVQQSDILHIDASNTAATIIGDLSDAPQIADNTFDCIVLTQTLHLIYNYKGAVETCYRILKPGGTLLLTVPGITPIDYGGWSDHWLWSFTERVMQKILTEAFAPTKIDLRTFGNVQVATAFLYGLGLPEVPKHVLDETDVHCPVIITAKATK